MEEHPEISNVVQKTLDATINMIHNKLLELYEIQENEISEDSLLKAGIDTQHTQSRIQRIKDLIIVTLERNVKDEMIAILDEEVKQLRDILTNEIGKEEDDKEKLIKIVAVTKQEVKVLTELVVKTIEEMNRYADMYEEMVEKLRGKVGVIEKTIEQIPHDSIALKQQIKESENKGKTAENEIESLNRKLEILKQANKDSTEITRQLIDCQENLKKEQHERNSLQEEKDELIEERNFLRKNLDDYQKFLMSKEEHNISLRSLVEQLINEPGDKVKTLLDKLQVEEHKNQTLLERLEEIDIAEDKQKYLTTIEEYKTQLNAEKARNKELNTIIQGSIKSKFPKSEDTVQKLLESVKKKDKEIQSLKSELKIIREPSMFTEEIEQLKKGYLSEKHKNQKLENELNALKRQWEMIFKQESGKHVDIIRMEHEKLESLKRKLESATETNANELQKERMIILEKDNEIHKLKEQLANAAVQYSVLSANMKMQTKGLGGMVEELIEENCRLQLEIDRMKNNNLKGDINVNKNGDKTKTKANEEKEEDKEEDKNQDITTNKTLTTKTGYVKSLLKSIKDLGIAIENLDDIVAKTYSVDSHLKQGLNIKDIIQLQKFGIETIMEDINRLMVIDESDMSTSVDIDKKDLINNLKAVHNKLHQRDELRSKNFLKHIQSVMDEISKQLTALESQATHFLDEGKATYQFLTNMGNQIRENLISFSSMSESRETKHIESIECILLSVYQKFAKFVVFGSGESEIMERFKIELLAMHKIYEEVSNISSFDEDSELKKQLATKRLLENVLKVKREVECIEMLENQIYVKKTDASDRRYLQGKIHEMELMIKLQKKEHVELKRSISKTKEKIHQSEIKEKEYEMRYRSLEHLLHLEKRKRNILKKEVENEREQIKDHWVDVGKRQLREELLGSEPITVEAMRIHLEDALAIELKTRLDLEHEIYCRKNLERELESIYLDMERTSMKGRKYLSWKEKDIDSPNVNVKDSRSCPCSSKQNKFILNLTAREKQSKLFPSEK